MGTFLAITDKIVSQLRDAWRSRWWGMCAAAVIFITGSLVLYALPDVYEARASVYVNTSSALAPVLKGLAVESDINSQLELVKQLLESRELLVTVIAQTGLNAAPDQPKEMDLAIAELRRRLQITGGRTTRDSLYTITLRDPSRPRALAVVGSLLGHFIEKTLGSKRGATASAEKFLQAQKQEYSQRLAIAENRLADFKRLNVGLLPGDRLDYFGRLQQEMDARISVQVHLGQLRSQREQIQKQLSGESPVTAVPGVTVNSQPGRETGGVGATAIDRRIADAETTLNQMKLQWTDEHPDVIAQKDLLVRLRAERARYLNALGMKGNTDTSGPVESNPVYESLRMALSQIDLKMFELQAQAATHASTIAHLQRAADTMPKVEAEYQQLNRDYSVLSGEYQEVVKRLETARLSGEADESEHVDFRIIEPAIASVAPVAPKRLLLLPGIFIAAIGLGVWVALIRSRMAPVFYTTQEVAQATGLKILGALGNTAPALTLSSKHRASLRFAAVGVALLLIFGLTLAGELLRSVGRLHLPGGQ